MFQAPLDKFTRAMGRTAGVDYRFCDHCTILFQYPIFDDEGYRKFYEQVQRSDETGYRSGEVPKKHLDKKKIDTDFKWGQFALMDLERAMPGKRVFEIGPAEGTLLGSFRDRGYSVAGIEPLSPYATYARDVLKLDVKTGYFDDSVAQHERADLVIFDGVLEHVRNPYEMLCQVRRMMNPDGILYVGGLPSAEVATPPNANVSHITLWSKRSLALALSCAGFQPLNIVIGRPTNRPHEWNSISQACLDIRPIEQEQPTLYPAPTFDQLSADWQQMLVRYAKSDARYEKYGTGYLALVRTARRVRDVARKLGLTRARTA